MKRTLAFLATAALMGVVGASVVRSRTSFGHEAVLDEISGSAETRPAGETREPGPEDGTPVYSGRIAGKRTNLVRTTPAARQAAVPPANAALHWLASRQNADGSFGSGCEDVGGEMWTPAGATSLSLLSFYALGWTHASKDRWNGAAPGDVIARGENWLRSCRPASDRDQALVSLALCESAGLSPGDEAKETAALAVQRLLERQRGDGSWEAPRDTVWAAMALSSARVSGMEVPERNLELLSSWLNVRLAEGGGEAEAFAWLLLRGKRHHPALRGIIYDSARNLPGEKDPDFSRCYFGSLAAFHYNDGPGSNGPDLHWVNGLRRSLVMSADKNGGWSGDIATTGAVVRNALGSMSLVRFSRTSSSISGPPVDLPPLDDPDPETGLAMGDSAPLDGIQDSGSDLLMGDSAPLEQELPADPE